MNKWRRKEEKNAEWIKWAKATNRNGEKKMEADRREFSVYSRLYDVI